MIFAFDLVRRVSDVDAAHVVGVGLAHLPRGVRQRHDPRVVAEDCLWLYKVNPLRGQRIDQVTHELDMLPFGRLRSERALPRCRECLLPSGRG